VPPERILAERLAVSRKTVLSAFEILKAEGWISSRQGSGTWVSLPPGRRLSIGAVDSLASLSGILLAAKGTLINMTSGQLEASPFVKSALRDLDDAELDELLASQHPMPVGVPSLIEAVQHQMSSEGVPATADQIVVTTGVQQAVTLLAAHYLRPGSLVITEPATSLGALDAFRAVGAQIEAAPPGMNGIDGLLQLAAERKPALIYVIPTHNNVTGEVMTALERRRIARFAEETGTPVIEDRSHGGVGFEDELPAPLASFSSTAEIAVVDSMSKRAWAGLRVGWVVAPRTAVGALQRAKSVADLGTPHLSQHVAVKLLRMAPEIDAERRATAQQRLQVLSRELREQLPSWEWVEPTGGLSLWVRLPGADAKRYAQLALRAGAAVLPGPLLSAPGYFTDRIRVSYHLPEQQLIEGARRLAAAWDLYTRQRPAHHHHEGENRR
jgi:DNA-binding transcriptional MocR family regulator